MHTYSVLSVLFAPAVVLVSAVLIHTSARAVVALSQALRGGPRDPSAPLPPARTA